MFIALWFVPLCIISMHCCCLPFILIWFLYNTFHTAQYIISWLYSTWKVSWVNNILKDGLVTFCPHHLYPNCAAVMFCVDKQRQTTLSNVFKKRNFQTRTRWLPVFLWCDDKQLTGTFNHWHKGGLRLTIQPMTWM